MATKDPFTKNGKYRLAYRPTITDGKLDYGGDPPTEPPCKIVPKAKFIHATWRPEMAKIEVEGAPATTCEDILSKMRALPPRAPRTDR